MYHLCLKFIRKLLPYYQKRISYINSVVSTPKMITRRNTIPYSFKTIPEHVHNKRSEKLRTSYFLSKLK